MQCVIDAGLDSCLNKPGEKSIMEKWEIWIMILMNYSF